MYKVINMILKVLKSGSKINGTYYKYELKQQRRTNKC